MALRTMPFVSMMNVALVKVSEWEGEGGREKEGGGRKRVRKGRRERDRGREERIGGSHV